MKMSGTDYVQTGVAQLVEHGSSSVGRAPVSKTGCREFEPLLPC